ncbi:MAG: hypothetical protein SWK76_05170 [Actinomycetota bacterium]|nr:hypothetical protein [Actinomycetota bacterium]
MKSYCLQRMNALAPYFISPQPGMPQPDPRELHEFGEEFFTNGTPAYRLLYFFLILILQGLCLLLRGKSLYALPQEEAEDFIQSLFSSRFATVSAIPMLLGTPIYMSHYNRDDVQIYLGFEVEALREEAAKREVTR